MSRGVGGGSSPLAQTKGVAAELTRLVEGYLDHLVVERDVSRHTLAAYRRDLRRYADYLAQTGVTEPSAVTPGMISEYAMRLREGTS